MGRGNWYDDMRGGIPSPVESGLENFSRGMEQVGQWGHKQMDRDYAEKREREALARQEAEMNRPVGAPVQDLLNSIYDKVNSGGLAGAKAGKLYRMVQNGMISEEQARAILNGENVSINPTPFAPGQPQPQTPSALPPMPGDMAQGSGAPPQINPAMQSQPVPPPPVQSPPVSPVPTGPMAPVAGGGMGPQRPQAHSDFEDLMEGRQSLPPERRPHTWTNRDLRDLQAAGGFPKERGKTESELMLEMAKIQSQKDIAGQNNATKIDITDKTLAQKNKYLDALKTRWKNDNDTALKVAAQKTKAAKAKAAKGEDPSKEIDGARKALNDAQDHLTNMLKVTQYADPDDPVMADLAKAREALRIAEAEFATLKAGGKTAAKPYQPLSDEEAKALAGGFED